MNSQKRNVLKSFLIELVVYAAFAGGYALLAVHLLDHWLKNLFDHKRVEYAFIAIGLMIAQGVLLQIMTSWLLQIIRKWRKRG